MYEKELETNSTTVDLFLSASTGGYTLDTSSGWSHTVDDDVHTSQFLGSGEYLLYVSFYGESGAPCDLVVDGLSTGTRIVPTAYLCADPTFVSGLATYTAGRSDFWTDGNLSDMTGTQLLRFFPQSHVRVGFRFIPEAGSSVALSNDIANMSIDGSDIRVLVVARPAMAEV